MGNQCCNAAGNQETLDIQASPDKKDPSVTNELTPAETKSEPVKVVPAQEAVAKPIEKPAEPPPEPKEQPAEKPAEEKKPEPAPAPAPANAPEPAPAPPTAEKLPKRWDITIKTDGAKLGVDLGTHQNKAAYMSVNQIKDGGLLKKFNTENAAQAVNDGDRIVSLNGEKTVTGMLGKIQGGPAEFQLTIERPNTWECNVTGLSSSMGLGVEMAGPQASVMYLQINAVKPDQGVFKFNEANPNNAIKAGDRILKCNGVAEDGTLIFAALGEAKAAGKPAVLLIERPA